MTPRFSRIVFPLNQLAATHAGSLGLSVSCLACEKALHLGRSREKYTRERHARENTTALGPSCGGWFWNGLLEMLFKVFQVERLSQHRQILLIKLLPGKRKIPSFNQLP